MSKQNIQKYISNSCSLEEFEDSLDTLLSRKRIEARDAIMRQHWNKLESNLPLPKEEITLYKIHHEINKGEMGKKRSLLDFFSRIAAILILPLTLALFYFASRGYFSEPLMQSVTTPLASRTNIELPDGTKVYLNSGSTIHFPQRFSRTKRKVQLEGQAYFDVTGSNIPFVVETSDCNVKVLGTAFDVSAYKNETTSVTLERGSVKVNNRQGQNTILLPGQQATISTGFIAKKDVDLKTIISWKDNVLIFDNELFETAVPRLERWFGIDMEVKDKAINELRLTGSFQFETISEILYLLEITNSIRYEFDQKERKLILESK